MRIARRAVLAAGLLGLAAPLRATEARRLRFVPQTPLVSLDPFASRARTTRIHAYMVFDTLFDMGSGLAPRPQMAEGHEWLDGFLTLVIRLRDGLRFHDGERVTARDVIASLHRWLGADVAGPGLAASLREAAPLGERALRLRFAQPQPRVLDAISKARPLFVMPADVLQAAGDGPVSAMIGSGPFRFLPGAWVPGEHAAYARFEGYQPRREAPDMLAGGKQVHFDAVEWRSPPDPVAAAGWVRSGEADWWEHPLPGLRPLLRGHPELRLEPVELWGFLGALRPNHSQPPFDNPRFRQAVFQLLDQAAAMRALAALDASPWRAPVGFFTPGTPLASEPETLPPAVMGREERRRLVAASGYGGETVVLLQPEDIPAQDALARAVAQQLAEAGVKVELRPTPWARLEAALAERGPAERRGWGALAFAFPATEALTPLTHSYLRAPAGNRVFGWPESPDIERHVARWAQARSPAEQRAEAAEIEAAAFRALPYIPLGQFREPHALRRDLAGLLRAPLPVMWNERRAA